MSTQLVTRRFEKPRFVNADRKRDEDHNIVVRDEFGNSIGVITEAFRVYMNPNKTGYVAEYVDSHGASYQCKGESVDELVSVLGRMAWAPALVFREYNCVDANESGILTTRDHQRLAGHLCDWGNGRYTAVWYEGDETKIRDFTDLYEARRFLYDHAEIPEDS